jgi:hypothetical protein
LFHRLHPSTILNYRLADDNRDGVAAAEMILNYRLEQKTEFFVSRPLLWHRLGHKEAEDTDNSDGEDEEGDDGILLAARPLKAEHPCLLLTETILNYRLESQFV